MKSHRSRGVQSRVNFPIAKRLGGDEAEIRSPLAMKKIEAIIKPFKLDDVKEALGAIGVEVGRIFSGMRSRGWSRADGS